MTTSEAVLVEVVYVLSSGRLYDLPRDRIRALLAGVLSLRGLHIPGKRRYLEALDLYADRASLSFVDALTAAQVRRLPDATLVSFDRAFDRIEGLTRREP